MPKIEAGESAESLKADGITVEVIASLGRKDNARVSDPSILHNAFDMMPAQEGGTSVKEVDLISGDVALIVLDKVNLPDNILPSQLDLVKSEAERENAIRDFSSALLVIKENANIDRNIKLVNKTN